MVKGLEPLLVNPGVLGRVQTKSAVSLVLLLFLQNPLDGMVGRICRNAGRRPRSATRAGRFATGHSPFLSGRRGVRGRPIEMVVPGNRAGGDGGSGGGSDVQPERRVSSGSGARGRRGALAETGISFRKGTGGNPEAGSMDGAGSRAQLGERVSSSLRGHAMATGPNNFEPRRTLETCTAPFLRPAKARVERRQDLASMVGTPCEA